MTLYDFLIIYLTCGAPLGVYYFLQHRSVFNSKRLWLKTILNFFFWQPAAYHFLRKSDWLKNIFNKLFARKSLSDAEIENKLRPLQKHLEEAVLESQTKVSVFELREIFERYAGLTLALQNENKTDQTARNKIFQIAGRVDSEVAAICLSRRNRKRLIHHQTLARLDFLNIFADLHASRPKTAKLSKSAIEFITLLNDAEAQAALNQMLEQRAQSVEAEDVKNAREDLWKPEPKPMLTNSEPTRLKSLTAMMNLRGKD